jgi:hypothetical protein
MALLRFQYTKVVSTTDKSWDPVERRVGKNRSLIGITNF